MVRAIAVVTSLGAVGCLDAGMIPCGDRLCPHGTACAPDGSCVPEGAIDACAMRGEGEECGFGGQVGVCIGGVCTPRVCGDGAVVAPEECESQDLNGASCLTFGFYEPAGLTCDGCRFDTTGCVGQCGDGITNGPELCDTVPGAVLTCSEVGFDYGSVTCSEQLCAPIYNQCAQIGWTMTEHPHDYPSDLSAPRIGDLYLTGESFYYHVSRGANVTVSPPPAIGCAASTIWATAEGVVFVAGSNAGVVCRDDGTGTAWTAWSVPLVETRDLWGSAVDDVYAVGDGMYRFDGSSWSSVATGAPPGDIFAAVHGRGGDVIAAVTQQGGIAIRDGAAWTYEVVDAGVPLGSVWVSESGALHAFGGGTVYSRLGGGWVPRPGPAAFDAMWGVGEQIYAFAYDRAFALHGAIWLELEFPDTFWWPTLYGGGAEHLVIVMGYQEFWEGSGFVWTPPSSTLSGAITAVWGFATDRVVAATNTQVSWFDGTAWSPSAAVTTGPQTINDLWGDASGWLVAVGMDGSIHELGPGAGDAWVDRSLTGIDLLGVWGESMDRIFAVGRDATGGVILRREGSTWIEVFRAAAPLREVWGSPVAGSYAVGTGALFHLAPGADPSQWVEVPLPLPNISSLWGDDQRLVVSFDTAVYTVDGGEWTSTPTPYGTATTQLIGEPSDVFAIRGPSLVRWDGEVWDRIVMPPTLPSATALFAGNGLVVVGSGDGAVSLLVRPRR